jgi:hypothetical protein
MLKVVRLKSSTLRHLVDQLFDDAVRTKCGLLFPRQENSEGVEVGGSHVEFDNKPSKEGLCERCDRTQYGELVKVIPSYGVY